MIRPKNTPALFASLAFIAAAILFSRQAPKPALTTFETGTNQAALSAATESNDPQVKAQSVNFTADSLHQDCEGKLQPFEKFDCYEQGFTIYMQAQGGKKTLELMESLQKLGGYALSNCHPLTHKIGNIALHVYGSVIKAVPEYIPVCASGFYHGLLEE